MSSQTFCNQGFVML